MTKCRLWNKSKRTKGVNADVKELHTVESYRYCKKSIIVTCCILAKIERTFNPLFCYQVETMRMNHSNA